MYRSSLTVALRTGMMKLPQAGWTVAAWISWSRKVRTPQGTTPANYRGGVASQEVNLPDEGHRNKQPVSFGAR